ncbi:MAG: hypothetical protein KG075_23340 [Alphaproteobacteria bacterium]|nr:hypothetical protein [Alphaproteobacteria bacterium]
MDLVISSEVAIDLAGAVAPLSAATDIGDSLNAVADARPCLWLEALGNCGRAVEPANVYLSIGEALAVIGLLAAFIQVAEPRFRFRLAVAPFPGRRSIYALFFAGTVLTVISSMLPAVPIYLPWPLSLTRSWEATAGVLFIAGLGIMFWRMTRWAHFSKRNAEQYYLAVVSSIAKGERSTLGQLVIDIGEAIKTIVMLSKQAEQIHHTQKQPPDHMSAAWHFLDLLADPIVARVLVREGSPTLSVLLSEIHDQKAYSLHLSTAIKAIVRAGLIDRESIFFRENEYGSLGRSKTITRAMFSNYRFVENYDPLGAYNGFSKDMAAADQFKLWQEMLLIAVEGYIDKGGNAHPAAFFRAFGTISHTAMSAVNRINKTPITDVYDIDETNRADAAGRVFGEILEVIKRRGAGLRLAPTEQLLTTKNNTFLYAVADGIFEYFSAVSATGEGWSAIRSASLAPLFELFSHGDDRGSPQIQQIREILQYKMIERVRENLIEGSYHPMTAKLISLFWLDLDGTMKGTWGEFSRALTEEIRQNFVTAFRSDRDHALSCLSENMVFDEKEMVISILQRTKFANRGQKKIGELKLNQPAAN